jgi:hypothetical protein
MSRRRTKADPAEQTAWTGSETGQAPTLAEYQAALEKIKEQAAELDKLRDPPGTVKPHLRCPLCFNGEGGRAARRKWQRQISGPLTRRCYMGTCGHEWTVEVRVEENDEGVVVTETKVGAARRRA